MEKQEALLRGDTSNAVVNRYFVYSFQGTGMHLCRDPDESPGMVRLRAVYGQKAWESLIEIYKTDSQKLKAQGLLCFVHALVLMGFLAGAQSYLLKVCVLVNAGNLRFPPGYGYSPLEQVREDAAVLSQAIYLENYFYLALGGPGPVKTEKIAREFWGDFQVRLACRRLEAGSTTWSSKRTHTCLIYAH